jgi:hypothetical protein
MALGSTHPLTEMSTGVFPGGKGGQCVRLTTLPPSSAVVMKSGNLNLLEPSGPLQACNGTALRLPLPLNNCEGRVCHCLRRSEIYYKRPRCPSTCSESIRKAFIAHS